MKNITTLFLLIVTGLSYAQQNKSYDDVHRLCDSASEAYRVKDYVKAETIAVRALELSKASGYDKGVVMSGFYRTIAKQMADPSTFDVQASLQFIDQFRKLGLKKEEARAYQFMARIYGNFGNVQEEMRYSLLALQLFEESGNVSGIAATHANLSLLYYDQNDLDEAFSHTYQAISLQEKSGDPFQLNGSYNNLAIIFEKTGPVDSAIYYHRVALDIARKANMTASIGLSLSNLGNNYVKKGQYDLAEVTLFEALKIRESLGKPKDLAYTHNRLANLYIQTKTLTKAKHHGRLSLQHALKSTEIKVIRMAYERLMEVAAKEGDESAELAYLKEVTKLKDSILNEGNVRETTKKMLTYNFEKKQLLDSAKNAMEKMESNLLYNKKIETERNRKLLFLASGAFFLLLALTIFRKYRFQRIELDQKKKIESAYATLQATHMELKDTQQQLIQREKMASLGELTAGIAHEIQNPLNFVNNFSEVNGEILVELKEELDNGNIDDARAIANDAIENQQKILHHGKRADAIVKGMLNHSRSSSGKKEPTDINALADEYLQLAYHGLRAKDKSFNATMKEDFDESIGNINIVPQDMGRVILNLINNAFYATQEKRKLGPENYEATVTIKTTKNPLAGNQGERGLGTKFGGAEVLISVRDNGPGIPQKILDKIFQPFFTTKPTGQGTGLGLSLSYDIVKAHGGELKVETKDGEGSEFIVQLPMI